VFTPEQIPGHSGRPASSTPLRDYLHTARHGVDPDYVVIPRSLAESMPLPWQHQAVRSLAELHAAFAHLSWPVYQVVPSRYERLVDLDEEQLAEVGCLMEIDTDGEVVYRYRDGKRVDEPEQTTVLVSCEDPLPPGGGGHVQPAGIVSQPTPPTGFRAPDPGFGPQSSSQAAQNFPTPQGDPGAQGASGYPPAPERQPWQQ